MRVDLFSDIFIGL